MLPLLQIPSGHHQVADAVSRWLMMNNTKVEIEKVEMLSYFNRLIEKMVSHTYLKWIDQFPSAYAWLYRQLAYHPTAVKKEQNKGYEWLFLTTMRELIHTSNPDLIICTHALPSYLCSRLKILREITQPVVNIYTDYFINRLWGGGGIDLHFAPSKQAKQELLDYGVEEERIYVTGIPVDYVFHQKQRDTNKYTLRQVLIAGGSIGVGFGEAFFGHLLEDEQVKYTILCGKNERLYEEIIELDHSHIRPLRYISSREEMKQLYDQMDAIITKPGGVTVSEALHSRLPIFIHSALPGQEEINRSYLFRQRIALPINLTVPIFEQIQQRLGDPDQHSIWIEQIDRYMAELEWGNGFQSLIDHL